MNTIAHAEWTAEAKRRFGPDPMDWQFVCPSCGHVARIKDWKDAGAPEGAVAFSCVGRYTGDSNAAKDRAFKHNGGPCNYTGGGLFAINPVGVLIDGNEEARPTFAFAEVTPNAPNSPAAKLSGAMKG